MTETRLAEILGRLTLACDLAGGFTPEKALRSCVLGTDLARRHGVTGSALRDVYYTVLLGGVGVTAFASEAGGLACGEDIEFNRAIADLLSDSSVKRWPRLLGKIGRGAPLMQRAQAVARLLASPDGAEKHARAICDASIYLARLVGVSSRVESSLKQLCETWDGKGEPCQTAGEALEFPSRVEHLACFAELAHHRDGREAALKHVSHEAGRAYDPDLAKTFISEAGALFETLEQESLWERYLDAEPEPKAYAHTDQIDEVAKAFAQLADVKSVWTLGHSTGVARIAVEAARHLELSNDETSALHRAALLHDIGRVSAPNRIWEKPGPLSASEWEVVRMHTYWTERILSGCDALGDARRLAGAAHERLDASGYHRGLPVSMLDRAARVLAASDVYHAMREARPHRPGMSQSAAAKALMEEVAERRLDRDACHAVLEVAGAGTRRTRSEWPRGLTSREVEVLRLLARGKSNKEIAAALGISPRTAQHHVAHVYAKVEVSSRAAAALFAVEQGLLDLSS